MKIAIMSDIHGNWEALTAVLRDIDSSGGVDGYWCLGDIVDYGPESHRCLEQIRSLRALTVLGNHDAAVCGKLDYQAKFSGDFVEVTRWTENHLTAGDKAWLAALPIRIETAGFTLVHGSPRDPFWEYILDEERAFQNLAFLNTPHCLVGHTHVKAFFSFAEKTENPERLDFSREMDKKYFKDGKMSFEFKAVEWSRVRIDGERVLVNPGGLGQQRGDDSLASYAVYNDVYHTLELKQVEYDLALTIRKMREGGLPEWLINKMAAGT